MSKRLKPKRHSEKLFFHKLTPKSCFFNSGLNWMFLGESKNCPEIKIRPLLNFHCIGLKNPQVQLGANKRYFHKTDKSGSEKTLLSKITSKKLCWTCNSTFGIQVLESKTAIFWQNWPQLSTLMTKRFVEKCNVIFQFTSENAVLDSYCNQLKTSSSTINQPKTIRKNNRALVSHYIKPKNFIKMLCLCKLTNKLQLQTPKLSLTTG